MSKLRYIKLLGVVEEDYKTVSGKVTTDEFGQWQCENVMQIKVGEDGSLPDEAAPGVSLAHGLISYLETLAGLYEDKSNE